MCNMKLRLKNLRTARGLTIDQAVKMTGLSRGFISQLENGKREPSAESLMQIAAAFGVQVRDLFDQDNESADLWELFDSAKGLSPERVKTLVLMARAFASEE